MSSDMWAKKDETDSGATHSGYQTKYGQTDGNDVEWLVDGAKAAYEMCDAFCNSTKFVYLIAAYFSPGIDLVRDHWPGGFLSYDNISSKYPQVIAKVNEINRSKGVPENTIPLVSLLAAKAEMGIPVRVVMFYPDGAQEHFGGAVDTDEAYAMVTGWSSKIDIHKAMWGGTYEGHELGAHHMKSAVAGTDDGLIAFCGGVDMAYARWASPLHQLNLEPLLDIKKEHDTLQDYVPDQKAWIDPSLVLGEWNGSAYATKGSQVLWHDVHAKVMGPAAYSLADNFADRYLNAQTRDSPTNLPKYADIRTKEVQQYRDSDGALKLRSDGSVPPPWTPANPVTAQILRSYYQWDPAHPGSGDYGIWDAYRNLFSQAKKSIYIESQYAFEDPDLTNILKTNLQQNRDLKVIIVAPVMPDNYDPDINGHIKELIQASLTTPGDYGTARVAVFSLASPIDFWGTRDLPIYVHAKIAVIDQEWTIVGSANLDRMGMGGKGSTFGSVYGSSELAVLVQSGQKAQDLLNSVGGEHAAWSTTDFENMFIMLLSIASENGKQMILFLIVSGDISSIIGSIMTSIPHPGEVHRPKR